MSARAQGGPAFPRPFSWDESPCEGLSTGDRAEPHDAQSGMTLRDYHAAHAPPYPFAMPKIDTFDEAPLARVAGEIAKWRLAYADAMILERAK